MPDGLPDVPAEMVDSIGAAIEGDTSFEQNNSQEPDTTATPQGDAQTEAATDAQDSFTKLDPNALPSELQPYYKALQADYTRKQQEAAPWRKLGDELGVESPEDFKNAAELYTYLQDPNNLAALYASLGGVLGADQGVEAYPGFDGYPPPPDQYYTEEQGFEEMDNPAVAALTEQVQGLQSYLAAQEAQQQQEALQWQLLGEMNRQEAMIAEQHPEWGEDEWTAVWNLAAGNGGNIVASAQAVEASQQAAITRLLNGKAAAMDAPGAPFPAPNRLGADAEVPDYSDLSLDSQTKQAVEFLRGVANMSE